MYGVYCKAKGIPDCMNLFLGEKKQNKLFYYFLLHENLSVFVYIQYTHTLLSILFAALMHF